MALKDKLLNQLKKRPLTFEQLKDKLGADKKLQNLLAELCKKKKLRLEGGRYFIAGDRSFSESFEADIIKLTDRFGFARPTGGEVDVFIPQKEMRNILLGDRALARLRKKDKKQECSIVAILEENNSFTGTVLGEDGKLFVTNDDCGLVLALKKNAAGGALPGDRVACEVLERGDDYKDFSCGVKKRFGPDKSAEVAAKVIIYSAGLRRSFPVAVKAEAVKLEPAIEREIPSRIDLRESLIFTIDGAKTRDIDDAISLQKNEHGWTIGVHIADVSHYVKPGSAIDAEARLREFSFYYPTGVIPMLPKELSNGICSLRPGEDRLCFSCVLELSEDAEILAASFVKTVINSRVQGVYEEVNELLAGSQDPQLLRKYGDVLPSIKDAEVLAQTLYNSRIADGGIDFEVPETEFSIGENGEALEVFERPRGAAERIIEEFMLAANRAAAAVADEIELPVVYRCHLSPSAERLATLKELLNSLGEQTADFDPDSATSSSVAALLERYKDTPLKTLVNRSLLRSMAKAEYSDKPLGHYGLGFSDYLHFTSPIRRYPDLFVHRVFSEFAEKRKLKNLSKAYVKEAEEISSLATINELLFLKTERAISACFAAEALSKHIGEQFSGQICGVTDFGMFVVLDCAAEGLVPISTIADEYMLAEPGYRVYSQDGNIQYRIGDRVNVRLDLAEVESGRLNLSLVK